MRNEAASGANRLRLPCCSEGPEPSRATRKSGAPTAPPSERGTSRLFPSAGRRVHIRPGVRSRRRAGGATGTERETDRAPACPAQRPGCSSPSAQGTKNAPGCVRSRPCSTPYRVLLLSGIAGDVELISQPRVTDCRCACVCVCVCVCVCALLGDLDASSGCDGAEHLGAHTAENANHYSQCLVVRPTTSRHPASPRDDECDPSAADATFRQRTEPRSSLLFGRWQQPSTRFEQTWRHLGPSLGLNFRRGWPIKSRSPMPSSLTCVASPTPEDWKL